MAAARVAIMVFMSDMWLLGYSIAFVVYGGALVREVITCSMAACVAEALADVTYDDSKVRQGTTRKGKVCGVSPR